MHLCVFDVYARCCVYFLLSVCFLIVNIMLCLFMHFVCFLFCVCTAAFCPCMPFTQLRGFPKHPRLPLIPNSTFSNFPSNGPVLVIRRHSIRSTDFSYLSSALPDEAFFCDIPLKGRNYNAWKSSEDYSIISSVYNLTVIQQCNGARFVFQSHWLKLEDWKSTLGKLGRVEIARKVESAHWSSSEVYV